MNREEIKNQIKKLEDVLLANKKEREYTMEELDTLRGSLNEILPEDVKAFGIFDLEGRSIMLVPSYNNEGAAAKFILTGLACDFAQPFSNPAMTRYETCEYLKRRGYVISNKKFEITEE